MALSASALRSYLIAQEDLPATPPIALVPVSVRTVEEAAAFGNRVSSMFAPCRRAGSGSTLAAGPRGDAVREGALRDVADDAAPGRPRHPARAHGRVARAAARLATEEHLQPPANVVISNILGSPAPLYFCGVRFISRFPLSMLVDGVGLDITVLSYGDKLDVGLIGHGEHRADVARLVGDLHDALADASPTPLAAAAVPEHPHPAPRPRGLRHDERASTL